VIRRPLYIAFGVTLGVLAVRQARKAALAVRPDNVAASLADRARTFREEVRVLSAERETELRAALGLDVAGNGEGPGSR
jgi:hypothetical protein